MSKIIARYSRVVSKAELVEGLKNLIEREQEKQKWKEERKVRRLKTGKSNYQEFYRDVVISFLIERDGEDCASCHKPVSIYDVSVDHKISRSNGGRNILSNLQLMHLRCNLSKGNRDF